MYLVGISADGWIAAADGSAAGFPVIFGSGVPLVTGSLAWALQLRTSTSLGAGTLLNTYARC